MNMSWIYFYRILKKTKGDIKKADPKEVIEATRNNPNSTNDAFNFALRKYAEDPKRFYKLA